MMSNLTIYSFMHLGFGIVSKKSLSHCHIVFLVPSRSFIVLSFIIVNTSTEKEFILKRKEILFHWTVCKCGRGILQYKTKVHSERTKRGFINLSFIKFLSVFPLWSLMQRRHTDLLGPDWLVLFEFWWFDTCHSLYWLIQAA